MNKLIPFRTSKYVVHNDFWPILYYKHGEKMKSAPVSVNSVFVYKRSGKD
jgi:hypothetical protein